LGDRSRSRWRRRPRCPEIVAHRGGDRALGRSRREPGRAPQDAGTSRHDDWSFQWIEAGIFVALAAVLVTFAIVWTLRRDA